MFYSLRTRDGVPMNEATLCARHYSDLDLREFAEQVAADAEDFGDDQWHDSTLAVERGEVACVECTKGL